MQTKSLLIIALCATVPVLAGAKKTTKAETAEPEAPVVEQTVTDEEPVITEDCLLKVSLFNESVKNKQFADAFDPWWSVYNTCPNANKAIYTQGAKIIEWKIANAADEAEKDQWRQVLMEAYDKRIKYFGNDPKYPVPYILGQKALDFCENFANVPMTEEVYGWFKQSIEGMGDRSQITVLTKAFEASYNLYKSNPDKYGEQFIADYSLISGMLQRMWDNPANKNATAAAQQKEYVDNLFASSGAADCDKLDELYAPLVETNADYLEDMLKLIKLYRRVNCTESDVYFAASAAAHKLEPTEESAAGCASMCRKKGEYKDAIQYYQQALDLSAEDDNEARADYLYNMAYISYENLENYPTSRNYARRSLEINPNQGRCYILIGMCYAAARPYSEAELGAKAAILNKTAFWAAVDQFQKAKQVDPTCEESANKLISSYSKYFPTKEEMFDLPKEFEQGYVIVGGWINERTLCRPAK